MSERFPWYKKVNPVWWLGDEDDKIVPPWYLTGYRDWYRRFRWLLRNFGHNFTWYVIGYADSLYLRQPNQVYSKAPETRWNLILPFISYCGKKWSFYIGWREQGNFGIVPLKHTDKMDIREEDKDA